MIAWPMDLFLSIERWLPSDSTQWPGLDQMTHWTVSLPPAHSQYGKVRAAAKLSSPGVTCVEAHWSAPTAVPNLARAPIWPRPSRVAVGLRAQRRIRKRRRGFHGSRAYG